MTRHRLTDDEIAETLLRNNGHREAAGDGTQDPASGAGERRVCIHEDRLWDLARGALDPELTAKILDHTLACPDCSLALRVAHETFAASGLPSEGPRSAIPLSGMWSRLAASILRPAPALVYLVLLILSFPAYRVLTPTATAPGLPQDGASVTPSRGTSSGGGAPAGEHAIRSGSSGHGGASEAGGTFEQGRTTEGGGDSLHGGTPAREAGSAIQPRALGLRSLRVLRLTGDLSLRNGSTQVAPLRVPLGEAEVLVLKLFPDVEDLSKNRGAALLIRVLDGGDLVASAIRSVSDLEEDQSLSLLLDGAPLHRGRTYVVEVTPTPPAAGSGGVKPSASIRSGVPPAPPILRQSFRLD